MTHKDKASYGSWPPYSEQRLFCAKETLIIGLFCRKWPIKIRHATGLRHPVASQLLRMCLRVEWLQRWLWAHRSLLQKHRLFCRQKSPMSGHEWQIIGLFCICRHFSNIKVFLRTFVEGVSEILLPLSHVEQLIVLFCGNEGLFYGNIGLFCIFGRSCTCRVHHRSAALGSS